MDQAENLRNIVKQQNQRMLNKTRVITVTSGKGGVGKSNTSINLALQFRKMGKRVIILDADFGLANIEVMFGVIPKYNLSDLIYNGKDIKEIICMGLEGVGFISGGSGIAKLVNLDNDQIKYLIDKLAELEKFADVIIIDTGAGITPSVLEFVASSPEVILVTTPEPTSVTDSYALLKALSTYEGFNKDETRIKMLSNKVETPKQGKALFDKLNMVVDRFLKLDIEFLGCVQQDNNISKAVMSQKPVSLMFPGSPAAKCYESIANTLMNIENVEQKSGINRFLSNIFMRKQKK